MSRKKQQLRPIERAPVGLDPLEPRLLLAAAPAVPHGFSSMRWHGRDTVVRTAQWIAKIDSPDQLASLQKRITSLNPKIRLRTQLTHDGLILIKSATRAKYENLLAILQRLPGFKFIEPNFQLTIAATPNDPNFPQQEDLNNTAQNGGVADADIDAPEAWDLTTGSPEMVVGVLDTGIDYTHPDLAANVWTNPFEIPNDGIDNDGNGYVDDIHGWDFANDDNDPMDDHGHGTHVSGTIAALGNNNLGTTGISWYSKIMALKIIASNGGGEASAAIAALQYASDMRARGVNIRLTSNSYGDFAYSSAMEDAVRASGEAGLLFVAAAGNNNTDTDTQPFYPASYNLPNIISVAATDSSDQRAPFSNYGATTVDIGAPGVSTLSTARGGGLTTLSGTSMATPHVSGVAALAFSISPLDTPYSVIRDAILQGGDPIASMQGVTSTGKRLNAFGALAQLPLAVISTGPIVNQSISEPPMEFQIGFSHPLNIDSIDAADLTVNGIPADSISTLDPRSVTFHFDTSPVSDQGLQTIALAADSVTRQLDDAGIQAFTGNFRYDALPMSITNSSLQLAGNEVHIDLQLNEAPLASSIDASDLQTSAGTVSSAQLLAPNLIRFTLTGITAETALKITVPAGAFTDHFGNPSLAHSSTLQIDFTTTALPTPLPHLDPLGSLIRGTSAPGLINSTTDTDTFTLSLNASQRLSLAVIGADGLRPAFELRDPSNQSIFAASAPAGSSSVKSDDIIVPATGTYSIIISSIGPTQGHYTLRASINSSLEPETYNGPANNTAATATPLSFLTIGDAQRAAIFGATDIPAETLINESEPNDNTATANPGSKNFLTTPPQLYQLTIRGNIDTPTDTDFYNVGDFQPGDILSIALSGTGSSRGALDDAYLELYRVIDDGILQITTDDDSGPVRDSLIYRFPITEAGTYMVHAMPFQSETGSYDLSLFLQNFGPAPITGGPQRIDVEPNNTDSSATNAANSWRAVQYISTTRGSTSQTDHDFSSYSLHLNDILTVEVHPEGFFKPSVTLRHSTGAALAVDDGTSLSDHNSIIYSFLVPSTGTYYLDISSLIGSGNYTSNVYLSTSTPPAAPTPIPDFYSFSLDANQQASLVIDNAGTGQLQLQLQDSSGATLATATAIANSNRQAIATFTAPASGQYFARITGERLQDYTLLVTRESTFDLGANDTSATAQPISSNVLAYASTDDDWYSISMSAGQTIQLSTSTPGTPDNPLDPAIELYDPAGALIAMDDNSAPDSRNAILNFRASAAGVYRIRIPAVPAANSGEYLLGLTRFWALAGSSGNDDFYATTTSSGLAEIWRNGSLAYSLPANLLNQLGIDGRGGDDHLTLDNISLQVVQPSATTSLTVTAKNAAQISLMGSPNLLKLQLDDTSRAALTPGGKTLNLSALELSPNATLDLEDGSLILQADESTRLDLLHALTQSIRTARAGGSWLGPGLTSSSISDRIHTLGIAFDPANPNNIFVAYRLIGDSDLDGDIDPDDFARIDQSFNTGTENPTYAQGDFDYSGSIDADDFFQIDRAFSSQ